MSKKRNCNDYVRYCFTFMTDEDGMQRLQCILFNKVFTTAKLILTIGTAGVFSLGLISIS